MSRRIYIALAAIAVVSSMWAEVEFHNHETGIHKPIVCPLCAYEKAVAHGFTTSISFALHAPAVIDTLGWLLVETGNSGRGLTLLQEAVAKAPHIAEIRYHLAVGLHKAGRNAEAKAELEKVLEMEQDSAAANNAQALLTELSKI